MVKWLVGKISSDLGFKIGDRKRALVLMRHYHALHEAPVRWGGPLACPMDPQTWGIGDPRHHHVAGQEWDLGPILLLLLLPHPRGLLKSSRIQREHRKSRSALTTEHGDSDEVSDSAVSPPRYSIFFHNAVHTSKGAFTSVTPRGEALAKASIVHLSQDVAHEKVAWSVQSQLKHVSMVTQGIKNGGSSQV